MMRRPSLLLLTLLFGCAAAPAPRPSTPAVREATHPAPEPWAPRPPPGPLAELPSPPLARVVEAHLENGLRVVVAEHHRRPVVSVRLAFAQGSAADPPGAVGATYFAVALLGDLHEDLDDEASSQRLEERSLRARVNERGAQLVHHVGADTASLGIDGYAAELRSYLDILAGAVRRPRCSPTVFDARRAGVIPDVEDIENADEEALMSMMSRAAFGTHHVYARHAFGSLGDLTRLGFEQVKEQQRRLLRPDGATLIVTGDVKAEVVFQQARQAFAGWRSAAPRLAPKVRAPVTPANPKPIVLPRAPAHAMALCVARPVGGAGVELEVLAELLGGGSAGGRLTEVMREAHGFAYSAQATIVRRRHAQAFLACTRVDPDETARALAAWFQVLEAARLEPPSEEALARAKRTRIAALELERADVRSATRALLTEHDLRPHPSLSARIEAVRAVTAREVWEAAQRVLAPEGLQLLLSGERHQATRGLRQAGLAAPVVVESFR